MRTETCEECEKKIGEHEPAFVFRGRIICEKCNKHLRTELLKGQEEQDKGYQDKRASFQTTDKKWLEKVLECYRDKRPFELTDDAGIGITAEDLRAAINLIKKLKETGALTWREICQILTGLGISCVGIWLIMVAVADPEPTSKLGTLLVGGVLLILTGGLGMLRALGQRWRVVGKRGQTVFAVEPD